MSLEIILGGALAALVAIIGAWFGGRRSGTRSAEQKQQAENHERVLDNLGKRETADHDARSGSSAADRLRDEFGRD